jgi:hypothetical protein
MGRFMNRFMDLPANLPLNGMFWLLPDMTHIFQYNLRGNKGSTTTSLTKASQSAYSFLCIVNLDALALNNLLYEYISLALDGPRVGIIDL